MGVTEGGGGPTRPLRKRADRRAVKSLIARLEKNPNKAVSTKNLRGVADVVAASKRQGTFNERDKKLLARAIKKMDKDVTLISAAASRGPLERLMNLSGYRGPNRPSDDFKDFVKKQRKTIGGTTTPAINTGKKGGSGNSNRPAPKKGGGRSGGGGGMNTSTPGLGPYSPGEFEGPSRREARVIVDRENQQLIRDLLGEASKYKQDLKYDVNKANALFNRSQGDLRYIYGEAQDYMGNRSQAIDNRYEQTGGVLGNIYQGLGAAVGQNTDAARANILAEQQRLGIQGSGTADLEADAANRQQIASYLGSAAQSSNEMARNAANEIGNLLGSMSAASLASAVGRSDNRRQDQISDARQGYRQDISEIRGDIGDVKRNRPGAISELHSAMQNNAYQQWAEGQQMAFNNQLATNKFNLDVSNLNSDNFWKRAAARQAAAKARAERRLKREEMQLEKTAQALDSFSKNFTLGSIFGG